MYKFILAATITLGCASLSATNCSPTSPESICADCYSDCDNDCQAWYSTTISECTNKYPPIQGCGTYPSDPNCIMACEKAHPFPGCS